MTSKIDIFETDMLKSQLQSQDTSIIYKQVEREIKQKEIFELAENILKSDEDINYKELCISLLYLLIITNKNR